MTTPQRYHLNLQSLFEALQEPLNLVDDPERRITLERYIASARLHLERAVFDLLAGAIEAVNVVRGVRARLEYETGALYLVMEPAAEDASDQGLSFNLGDDVDKVTIRIPAELKDLISQAANLRGLSINSWYIRELARAVRDLGRETQRDERRQGRGSSLHGFVGDD